MPSLMIADLAHTDILNAHAMAAVRGGSGAYKDLYPMLAVYDVTKSDLKFDATQLIGQKQNVVNENGNNVAFASDITSTVKPIQSANNKIDFS